MNDHDEIYADFDDDGDEAGAELFGIDWNSVVEYLPPTQHHLAGVLDEAIEQEDDGETVSPGCMNELLAQAVVNLEERGKKSIILQDAMDEAGVMIRNRRREHALDLNHVEMLWDANGNYYFENKTKPFTDGWKYIKKGA